MHERAQRRNDNATEAGRWRANRLAGTLVAGVLWISQLIPGGAAAGDWQSLESVRAAAEAFVLEHTRTEASVTVQAGELDPRLRLASCDGQLVAFRPPGARLSGNTTVGVRCSGRQPWKLFVPVRSRATGLVLVTTRALARGAPLRATDVSLIEHDLGQLPYGYMTQPEDITGRILRRPVAPGTVLTPVMLGQARMIQRGQAVTLVASHGGIRIRMAGKALMDGGPGQRIRVENSSSGRVIEGMVRSEEQVEVLTR